MTLKCCQPTKQRDEVECRVSCWSLRQGGIECPPVNQTPPGEVPPAAVSPGKSSLSEAVVEGPGLARRSIQPESIQLLGDVTELTLHGKQPAEIIRHLLDVYSEEPPAEVTC